MGVCTSKPRKFRLQFTVRSLLLVTVFVALIFSYFTYQRRIFRRQAKAREVLSAANVKITYQMGLIQPDGRRVNVCRGEGLDASETGLRALYRKAVGDDVDLRVWGVTFYPSSRLRVPDARYLRDLPYLEAVYFEGVPADDVVLNVLANCQDLRTVSFGVMQINGACLRQVALHQKVETLRLQGRLDQDDLRPLSQFRSVTDLDLSDCRFAQERLDCLGGSTSIEELDLSHTNLRTISPDAFDGMEALRELDLTIPMLQTDNMEAVVRCAGLRKLSLGATWIGDEGVELLSRLTNLQELDLSNTNIEGSTLRSLEPLREFRVLDCHGTEIADSSALQIAKLRRIRILNLGDSWVSDQGVAALSTLPDLEELDLVATEITDDSLGYLQSTRSLRKLRVCDRDVSPEAVDRLRQHCPDLEVEFRTGYGDYVKLDDPFRVPCPERRP